MSPRRRTADGVVQAACLLAVVALPLYFSVQTPTAYEADKAVFLRVLALVVAGAWLLGMPAPGGAERSPLRDPILWTAVALFTLLGLATVFSIDPRLSLWGSQGRQEGLWTRVAYLVILAAIVSRFRNDQVRGRLVSFLLLGALPAVAYGLAQSVGLDPIPSSGDPNTLNWPVRSTFGQHIFFASFLVIVIPFTAARVIESWEVREWETKPAADLNMVITAVLLATVLLSFFLFMYTGFAHPALWIAFPALLGTYLAGGLFLEGLPRSPALMNARPIGYGLLLFFELVVLLSTGARGAWLGFLASVPVFALLLAKRRGLRRAVGGILGTSVVVGLLLILLNIPNGPLQPLRTVHGLSRVANITESGGADGSAQGRVLIWQGVGKLMTNDPSIGGTWGGPLRDLTGYGPETLHWAFNAVYPLKLRRVTSEIWTWDRAHDIYLDYLVDAGVLAVLAFLAVLVLFFRRVWVLLGRVPPNGALLLIAAASAMAGHLVDGVFGIETVTTALLLWVMVGLVAGAPTTPVHEPEATPSLSDPVPLIGAAGATVAALILGLVFDGHPSAQAAVWLLAILVPIGFGATALTGRLNLQGFVPLPRHAAFIGAAVFVLVAAGLAPQLRFETAALADASGLRQLSLSAPLTALPLLQTAVRNDGQEPKYATDLAGAYEELGAGRADTSLPSYVPTAADAVTLSPQTSGSLGSAQLYQLALFSLQSAGNLSPLDPDVHDNLGSLYLQFLNLPSQAYAEFQRAERLSVNNPRYIDEEAQARLGASDSSAAAATAQQALNLDTTFWYSYYTLAMVDHQIGAHSQARQAAQLSLYWAHNFWPPPPSQQIAQLHTWQQDG